MIYYKTFQRRDGLLKPLLNFNIYNFPHFHYVENAWNFPPVPNSKLFCWDKPIDSNFEMWEIEVKNPIRAIDINHGLILGIFHLNVDKIELYWNRFPGLALHAMQHVSEDVILADAVKLIRRIK